MSNIRESVQLTSSGDRLVGEFFTPAGSDVYPAMIVCHGAGEYKENHFEMCQWLAGKGVAALALDMHGHGESGGDRFHVEMTKWVADIRAAVEFLSTHPRVDANRIGAFGMSSGGTAILEAALVEPRLRALVTLDATVRNWMPRTTAWILQLLIGVGHLKRAITNSDLRLSLVRHFADVRVAADPEVDRKLRVDPVSTEAFRQFPFPGGAQSFFVDTLKRVSRITIPTLVLWGEQDEVDPPETGRVLYDTLVCKKRLDIIAGNGHVGHLDRNRHQVYARTADWALEHLA